MSVFRSTVGAALLVLPALASHAMTTAEFASKAPAAPITPVASARAASAATPTRPATQQRQADDKAMRPTTPAAPKPGPR